MKRAESESFLKSFLVFFVSLSLLSGTVLYFGYLQKRQTLENTLFNEMKLCSFKLDCTQFTFDFAPLQTDQLYQLKRDEKGLFALFSVPGSNKYALKLHYADQQYEILIRRTQKEFLKLYLLILSGLALLSALFSIYTLYPLRKALRLTEEFSKDILHDLNTPLASLRLNISSLKLPPEEEKKRRRIESSIETMVSLGNNLRSYLEDRLLQKEVFDLHSLLQERIEMMQKLYPSIRFTLNDAKLQIATHKDAMIRILDNLLNNAAKYNVPNGSVRVTIDSSNADLTIQDLGKGIAHPEKIFDRFYKEHERGLGIGLHIVGKLCHQLHIPIRVESRLNHGSSFHLDLRELTIR